MKRSIELELDLLEATSGGVSAECWGHLGIVGGAGALAGGMGGGYWGAGFGATVGVAGTLLLDPACQTGPSMSALDTPQFDSGGDNVAAFGSGQEQVAFSDGGEYADALTV